MLEYCGRGKSLIDVGLAQAKTALCTRYRIQFFDCPKFISGHTTSKLRLLILEAVVTLPLGSPGKIIQGTDIQDGTRAGKAL